jgi:glycosyltransferase involved in cell wall biosynthesis
MRSETPIRYSIVVPFFNEQENIPTLYMKITEVMDSIGEPYEMVFVDDGSKDNTYRVLSEIYEHDRRVNVVRLRRNFGQTPALKAGFDFARGEIVISMDGDLQHDPEEIPLFLEKIEEGYDLVSGWRYQRKDHWLMRQVPSRVANWLMAKLSGIELHDFGTTFKAYRREILQEIQLYGELHRFIPALASSTGARITEVPISNPERQLQLRNWAKHTGVLRSDHRQVSFGLFHATASVLRDTWTAGKRRRFDPGRVFGVQQNRVPPEHHDGARPTAAAGNCAFCERNPVCVDGVVGRD